MASKPLIMVVEQNRTTQNTLKRDLEALGFDVFSVLTTKEAWELLESGTRPDVMVLGFYFPEEDGPKFFRRLQSDPRFRAVPVVPLMPQSDQDLINLHAIISKNGSEEPRRTPKELILAITQAAHHKTGKTTLRRQWAKLIGGLGNFLGIKRES